MNRLWLNLSHLIFILLVGSMLWFTAFVCFGVLQQVGKPSVGFTHTDEGFVNPVGLSLWEANLAGLRAWDRIVAVRGELVFTGEGIRREAFKDKTGTPVIYQVEGIDQSQRFVMIPTRTFRSSDLMRSHGSQSLLGLVFVMIAILLYVLRPATIEAWAFVLFFGSVGICMTSVVNETMLWEFPTLYGYVAPFLTFFALILVGALVKAFRRSVDPQQETSSLHIIMWIIVAGAFVVSSGISLAFHFSRGDIRQVIHIDDYLYGWLAIGTLTGLSSLFIAYRRSRVPRRRARLRQILWAIPVGAGIPTANLFIGNVFETTTISFLWNGFVLILPLATADAIVRHDLLQLNKTARRLVGGLAVAAAMGMVLGFVLWSAAHFLSVVDAAGMVALAALLFAVAAPLNHRAQDYVDHLLREQKYDSGRLLADFSARASTANHLDMVVTLLKNTLSRSVQPAVFALYRKDGEMFQPVSDDEGYSAIELTPQLERILSHTEAVLFDEDSKPPKSIRHGVIALRLAVANEPVGLLVLGERSEDRAYEGGDIAFVESLAGPMAAALVNTRAYQEVESLNQELEARVMKRTRELEEKNEELALLNNRKDELVATVSHDFRSPLAIIRQNVQTVLRDLTVMDEDDLRHFLQGIERQESRLASMCESLLDLAKLKQHSDFSDRVDLAIVCDTLISGFMDQAEKEQINLAFVCDPNQDYIVAGDGERLEQVVQNLVDNAVKFTEANGRVTVSLTRLPKSGEQLARVSLQVSDTGCGIPSDVHHRLFEPFFQVPLAAHVGQGSGLGLAIAHAVIDAHGGAIEVESEPDRGTVFRITLSEYQETNLKGQEARESIDKIEEASE